MSEHKAASTAHSQNLNILVQRRAGCIIGNKINLGGSALGRSVLFSLFPSLELIEERTKIHLGYYPDCGLCFGYGYLVSSSCFFLRAFTKGVGYGVSSVCYSSTREDRSLLFVCRISRGFIDFWAYAMVL